MNRLLYVALAAAWLGSSGALAQTDPQSPAHRELPNQEPATLSAGAQSNLAAGGEQTGVADPGRRRLSDPKSGCAGFDLNTVAVDAIAWSGDCVGGLAGGPGVMTFSNQGKFVESLAGNFDRGVVLDGNVTVKFANGSSYEGDEVAARMEGTGLFTTADGDRLQGQWAKDRLNGHGVVTWANGDCYEGEWRDGKAEGQGVQTWSDGRKYDGQWRNDLPNGHGVVTRKDGSRYEGTFADGHPSAVTEVAAATPVSAPIAPTTVATKTPQTAATTSHDAADHESFAALPSIDQLADKKFSAIDGSTFSLTPIEGGLRREIGAPDGSVKTTQFEFLSDKLGAVHEGGDSGPVAGVFRVTGTGITVDYADGRTETLILNTAGGVSMLQKPPAGAASCMSWYPAGHSFSMQERKAALAEYAGRIGLQEPRGKRSGAAVNPSCILPAAETIQFARARTPAQKNLSRRHASAAAPSVMVASLPSAPDPNEPIVVRNSQVHLIDADALAPAKTPDPGTTASNEPGAAAPDGANASGCLTVESDGQHWGFRNRCAYDVQFAYCLMNTSDPLTACGAAIVSGSVAANGFGALIADQSLHEVSADHDFRWVACGGGAGEVAVHLDRSDPPVGRCIRRGPS